MNWIELIKPEQLDEINAASVEKAQIIFKHSTQCNISADALAEMNKMDVQAWYLDLLSYRNISNQIADNYMVLHKSPQVIIIKDGKAIYNESHWKIKSEEIMNHL